MSTTVAFTPVDGSNAPATLKEGWLPSDSGIPELDELRNEYLRLTAKRHAEFAEVVRLKAEIEKAEARREQAKRDAYLGGGTAEPEDIEPLKQSLKDATQRCQWAGQALLELINRAVGTVVENHDEWVDEIDERDAELRREAQALEAQLRELRIRMGGGMVHDAAGREVTKLRFWLARTADAAQTHNPGAHFPYAEIHDAPPADPEERENWKRQIMEDAMFAGSPFQKHDIGREEQEAEVAARYNADQEHAISEADERMGEEYRARLRSEMVGEPGVI